MEEHRMKEMPEVYDKALFQELYQNTEKLRNKLAYEIDSRRFGVETEDIKSWFDCKFIYAFVRYHDKKDPDMLKGYILNSLSYFKCRILRKAYSKQNEAMMNNLNVDDYFDHSDIIETTPVEDDRLQGAVEFLKKNLSTEAYDLFLAQTYPPDYIVHKLKDTPQKLKRVPRELLAEFFGKTEKEIEKYQREYRKVIKLARVSLT